ncbi:MAG: undecaprenyldiphospho-muramoylpentapeptide beta-N-acetylglucosaminyltransferase, partial [Candidatus Sericytochromatia bacterium]|nr:undecaprenyldiphospho-muramoylpentapeptide beta-N-acetylglucosaminyltransferase [Candidatus Sericytochromatia bacterium]
MKKIVMTGGGSAGHVTPNIALSEKLKNQDFKINYIGSINGIERQIIQQNTDIDYYGISSGKLRRYFSLENFIDPFKVVLGLLQAYLIIKKLKPDVIFSKGGFVTVPVVIAGYFNRVPVIIHESDMTPGLANKIAIPFAKKVCTSFLETLNYLPKNKGVYTGTPIREDMLQGNKEKGLIICNFDTKKPILLIIGGSLGSQFINNTVRKILKQLLEKFQVIHICGKSNVDDNLNLQGYKQFEYLNNELSDIFAISDIVISRAGSNAIFELLALKKPNLLIPLSKKASRGDQILNAQSFAKAGYSKVIQEDDINEKTLYEAIIDLYNKKEDYIDKMNNSPAKDSINQIV